MVQTDPEPQFLEISVRRFYPKCRPKKHSNKISEKINEFVIYHEDEEEQTCYFRIFKVKNTCSSYVSSKHLYVFNGFQSLFVNMFPIVIGQNIKYKYFLLRSKQNYQLLEPNQVNPKIDVQQFTLKLLEFFYTLLELNKQLKLDFSINQETIFYDMNEQLKLGDLKLMFYPYNIKLKQQKYQEWTQKIMRDIKCFIVFFLEPDNQKAIFQNKDQKIHDFIVLLKRQDNSFIQNKINLKKIEQQRINISNQKTKSLTTIINIDATVSEVDITNTLLYRENSRNISTTIPFNPNVIRIKRNHKRWNISLILFILFILLIGAMIALLSFGKKKACNQNQYIENKQCKQCYKDCVRCSNGGEQDCTLCRSNQWLNIKTQQQIRGKCTVQCNGRKIISNRHCIL